jgi:hypothetical protein
MGRRKMNAERQPVTYGDLRKLLARAGDPWEPDPTKADEEELPVYPTGGDGVYEPDSRTVGEGGVDKLLAEASAPPNPDLRAEWREEGLLPDDEGAKRPPPKRSARKKAKPTPAPDSGG